MQYMCQVYLLGTCAKQHQQLHNAAADTYYVGTSRPLLRGTAITTHAVQYRPWQAGLDCPFCLPQEYLALRLTAAAAAASAACLTCQVPQSRLHYQLWSLRRRCVWGSDAAKALSYTLLSAVRAFTCIRQPGRRLAGQGRENIQGISIQRPLPTSPMGK